MVRAAIAMVGAGADEDAGDARSQQNPRSLRGAGGKHRELIPAMPFGHPSRLVTEAFGEPDTVDDLGRTGASRECYADSSGINHMGRRRRHCGNNSTGFIAAPEVASAAARLMSAKS